MANLVLRYVKINITGRFLHTRYFWNCLRPLIFYYKQDMWALHIIGAFIVGWFPYVWASSTEWAESSHELHVFTTLDFSMVCWRRQMNGGRLPVFISSPSFSRGNRMLHLSRSILFLTCESEDLDLLSNKTVDPSSIGRIAMCQSDIWTARDAADWRCSRCANRCGNAQGRVTWWQVMIDDGN